MQRSLVAGQVAVGTGQLRMRMALIDERAEQADDVLTAPPRLSHAGCSTSVPGAEAQSGLPMGSPVSRIDNYYILYDTLHMSQSLGWVGHRTEGGAW